MAQIKRLFRKLDFHSHTNSSWHFTKMFLWFILKSVKTISFRDDCAAMTLSCISVGPLNDCEIRKKSKYTLFFLNYGCLSDLFMHKTGHMQFSLFNCTHFSKLRPSKRTIKMFSNSLYVQLYRKIHFTYTTVYVRFFNVIFCKCM